MVWDCASETLLAIDPENRIKLKRFFDASPGGITQAFAAMKSLNAGPYEVDSVRLVTAEKHQAKNYHLIRNSWVTMLETKLFTHLLFFNQLHRTAMDVKSNQNERKWHTEEYDKWLRRLEMDARVLIKSAEKRDKYLDPLVEDKLDVYRDIIANKDIPASRKDEFAKTQIRPFLRDQIEFHRSQSESVNLFPDERVNHQIRSDIFQDLLKEMR